MKYTITVICLSLFLTGCGRSDLQIQQEMAGTWLVHFGGSVYCINVIRPDGGYTASVTGFANGNVIRIKGTILARHGKLIETITADSDPGQQLPMIVHGHIIRLDDHQMITRWDTVPTTTTVAQKIKQ